MRGVSVRVAIGLLLAASSWAQKSSPIYTAPLGEPEDSPEAAARNLIFYDNPRGLQPTQPAAPSGAIAVEQLQHPLSRKALKLLRKADKISLSGNHQKAIEQLRAALKEPSAVPYAHSMLGQEYLKLRQIPSALAELEQAAALLPHSAAIRSNLAYALFLSGDLERSEQEGRHALDLDRNNPKTRSVLDQILLARRTESEVDR